MRLYVLVGTVALLLVSCSVTQRTTKLMRQQLLTDSSLAGAHLGVSIYEPATHRVWADYQSHKYFVPASNTKLLTLFTGLLLLGDSLPSAEILDKGDYLLVKPMGDPSFLHRDFIYQPLFSLLKHSQKPIRLYPGEWSDEPLGAGWSWDDYNDDYMGERSAMPIYGNVIRWTQTHPTMGDSTASIYSDPEVDWPVNFAARNSSRFSVKRDRDQNRFQITEGPETERSVDVPFVTNGLRAITVLLADSLGAPVTIDSTSKPFEGLLVKSQPVDSLFRLMMHRSDNFFAEQTLLTCSERLFSKMSVEMIIDSMLNGALKGFPDRPNWVDGSGLSRYNMMTPADLTWLMDQLLGRFGEQRIAGILPTGNEGTLRNYYADLNSNLHAKTGTLSGQVAITGFFTTKRGRRLEFSVLVNNHASTSTKVRRAVEKFLTNVWKNN